MYSTLDRAMYFVIVIFYTNTCILYYVKIHAAITSITDINDFVLLDSYRKVNSTNNLLSKHPYKQALNFDLKRSFKRVNTVNLRENSACKKNSPYKLRHLK